MQYLLLIHIGPVQDFIASARKSRDLWYGSWMLSEMSKAAAHTIVQSEGTELIFPAPEKVKVLAPGSDLNVSNHILALVSSTPSELAQKARDAIDERLHNLRDDAYQNISSLIETQAAQEQIDDLLEWYWVSVHANGDNYKAAREQAEALLAARKGTRDYRQPTWALSGIPKSSLDGSRESVIPEKYFKKDNETFLYKNFGARRAERLSGVDLLKRHGRRVAESHFPSTSHMAALPYLAKIGASEAVVDLWQAYADTLADEVKRKERIPKRWDDHPVIGSADGSLLFESRLRDLGLSDEDVEKSAEKLQAFLDRVSGSERPIPYYALLLADGDSMGKVINAQNTWQDHRKLSQTLAEFAGEVPEIVEQYQGALVYAGGDDVLAFLPLHTVLNCARELAKKFCDKMKDKGFKDDGGHFPTFSAGVAITHHLEPMSDAFELARNTEREAKSIDGKDALAIAVDKRSGVTRTIKGKWGAIDQRLDKFVNFHRRDAFPDGAAYQLHDAARDLGTNANELLQLEAKRIINRKRAEGGSKELTQEVTQYVMTQVAAISVDQLADELIITKLLADAQDQAQTPLTAEEETGE